MLYEVEFPLCAKAEVNGPDAINVYRWLRRNSRLFDKSKNLARVVPWNFTKFIVSADLKTVEYFNPDKEPKFYTPLINKLLES